jgi:DNA helicase-2/ATP-dependent DNA helicase PcrA
MLSAEIANIYKRMDRVRKVHNVIFAPSLEVAGKIHARLDAIGNVSSDGRPILGLDSRDLLEIVLEAGEGAFLVPAHIWTPWFSALGSKSGFDCIEDCYGDLTGHIGAVETGLSSDPPMNWRLSRLDRFVLVSHSDAHSPAKLGREADELDTELSYEALFRALHDPADRGLAGTIEFFPEEGKYHFDGHRTCACRLHPKETIAHGGLCPVCGRKVTVGVMARVEELADREEGDKGARWRPYRSLIPLPEIIGEALKVGPQSKRVQRLYREMLSRIGNEFSVLLDTPLETIGRVAGPVVAEGVRRVRTGAVHIAAGYDGEFGRVRIFTDEERRDIAGQVSLFEGVEDSSAVPKAEGAKAASPHRSIPSPTIDPAAGERARVAERPASFDDTADDDDPARPANLNAAQWRVVCHEGGHLLIAAGPGTGKTHTITRRIARLAEGLAAGERILAVTFTNKAAEEMRERLAALAGEGIERVEVGTFHQFCLKLLRDRALGAVLPDCFRIATPDDCTAAARAAWPDLASSQRNERLESISLWKARACEQCAPEGSDAYHRLLRERGLVDFDDLLVEALGLIEGDAATRAVLHDRYRLVFVDEYQDLNPVQHRLTRGLVGPETRLCAIGDRNQAIYGFRGASAALFGRFTEDFPGAKLLHLSENYRSGPVLLRAGAQVIAPERDPAAPALLPRAPGEGRLVVHAAATDRAEAEYVVHSIERMVGGTSMFSQDSGRVGSHEESERSFGDFAVLYRLNAQKRLLVEAFERSGIPYHVSGATPLAAVPLVAVLLDAFHLAAGGALSAERCERVAATVNGTVDSSTAGVFREQGDACLADMRSGPGADPALGAVVRLAESLTDATARLGVPAGLALFAGLDPVRECIGGDRGSGQAWETVERLAAAYTRDLPGFLASIALRRAEDERDAGAERVRLMTLHAAKGLEFPVVFITGCEERLIPLDIANMSADPSEERRLFYVGVTRARERLHLVRANRRSLFGETIAPAPSPFLGDIEERLKRYEESRLPGRRAKSPVDGVQLSLFG